MPHYHRTIQMHSFRTVSLTSIIFCMCMFFVGSAFGDPGQKMVYKKYANVRFGYEISYPGALLSP
jgi:hypothetical protein